jgi:hypothetical protein
MKRCVLDAVPSREEEEEEEEKEAFDGSAESWPSAICYYPSSFLTPEGRGEQTGKGKLIKLSVSVSV